MSTIETTAIYENGVLRIAESLELAEKSEVFITVHLPEPNDAAAHTRQVHEALVRAGLSLPVAGDQPLPAPLSDERREELDSLFARGRPLSELIVEERADQHHPSHAHTKI